MKRFREKVVVITGASSGIGAALGEAFFNEGAHLVLLARRLERLDELKSRLQNSSQKILCLTCDVTQETDIENAYATAVRELGRLDVVVANAGFGVVGSIERLKTDDYRRQFETNIFGVIHTVKLALAELRKTKGIIAVVGSINGYAALAGNAPYAMSKFAVRAFCESLRPETAEYGVSVTHIAPGFVKSEIQKVDNRGVLHPKAKDSVPAWIKMDADKAARKIVNALYFRSSERVITGHGKVVVWWVRFFPSLFRLAQRWIKIRARRMVSE